MITGEAEFETALEEADRLLDPPPVEGAPQHARLLALLKDLAAWRPNLLYPAEPAIAAERARLATRLEAFEARLKPPFATSWEAFLRTNFRFK